MLIDGKALADTILNKLSLTVDTLKKHGIIPTLAVILVGEDPGSLAYIRQKRKACDRIGAKLILEQFPASITPDILSSAIAYYNNDTSVHGLIIQRPIPVFVGEVGEIITSVSPGKDVDGFVPHSPFEVPVAKAVITILETIHSKLSDSGLVSTKFKPWLNSQAIAILGRGETAGKPVAAALARYDCTTSIIHSKTLYPEKILKNATVIISCVGKRHVITRKNIRRGAILISVGLYQDRDGKLYGDYDNDSMKDFASFYTPTPGGVGPVNIACLMRNLVDATIVSAK